MASAGSGLGGASSSSSSSSSSSAASRRTDAAAGLRLFARSFFLGAFLLGLAMLYSFSGGGGGGASSGAVAGAGEGVAAGFAEEAQGWRSQRGSLPSG